MHQPYALLLTSEVVLLGNIDSFKKEKEGIFGSNVPRIIATTYICKAKRMSWHVNPFQLGCIPLISEVIPPISHQEESVVKKCHIYGIFIDPGFLSSTLMMVPRMCCALQAEIQCNCMFQVHCILLRSYVQRMQCSFMSREGSLHSIDICCSEYRARAHCPGITVGQIILWRRITLATMDHVSPIAALFFLILSFSRHCFFAFYECHFWCPQNRHKCVTITEVPGKYLFRQFLHLIWLITSGLKMFQASPLQYFLQENRMRWKVKDFNFYFRERHKECQSNAICCIFLKYMPSAKTTAFCFDLVFRSNGTEIDKDNFKTQPTTKSPSSFLLILPSVDVRPGLWGGGDLCLQSMDELLSYQQWRRLWWRWHKCRVCWGWPIWRFLSLLIRGALKRNLGLFGN